MDTVSCQQQDLASGLSAWLIWGLPWALIAVGAVWSPLLYWLWIPAFLVAGGACVYNAGHCGRLHCYATGPLYLLAAAYTVLAAFHIAPLSVSWFLGLVLGLVAAAYLAEAVFGRYRASTKF